MKAAFDMSPDRLSTIATSCDGSLHMKADSQSPDCQLVLNRSTTLCSQVQDKEDGGRQMVEAGKGEALHGVAL